MLLVEKLAKEASTMFYVRSCGSYLEVFNPHSHNILKQIHDKFGMDLMEGYAPHENPAQDRMIADNLHVMFMIKEACYAGLLRGAQVQQEKFRWTSLETAISFIKQNKFKVDTSTKVFKESLKFQQPEYVVFLQQNQWRDFDKDYRKEDGSVDFEKLKKGLPYFDDLDEAYSELCKLPWIADSLVGKDHSLTKHLEHGAIFKTKTLTCQQVFVKAITLRFPLEWCHIYVPNYVALKKYGFKPSTAALLALTMASVGGDSAIPSPGGGHDWCYAKNISLKQWGAMLKGTYSPVWTQKEGRKWGGCRFEGFAAIHGGGVENPIATPFLVKKGDGWNTKIQINLEAMKEEYDKHNS